MENEKFNRTKSSEKENELVSSARISLYVALLEDAKRYSLVASELQRIIKEGQSSLILKPNKNK